jgi:carboxymethylenebutenolidase
MGTRVELKSRSGGEMSAELASPDGSTKGPAVVLIQEFWGVNDHIRSIAARLADAGFFVVAPDLYHGKIAKDATEAGAMMKGLDRSQALDEIAGAIDFAAHHARSNGKVGVMGFCMGGAYALGAASVVPQIAAVVPFYGLPPEADYTKIKAPVLMHVASKDGWVKPALAEAVKATVDAAGGSMELHVYEADHAFFNDTRPEVYNPAAAKLAWERSITFLRKHLAA